MKDNDLETREKILNCTLELIKKEKDFSKISVRKIVSNAKASLSSVNYHFRSKEKLINEVVRKPILEFLGTQAGTPGSLESDPVKKLKQLVKLPARFLAENTNISRVSILSDMTSPVENDLTEQTLNFLMPTALQVFPGKTEKEVAFLLWEVISAVQTIFLRADTFKRITGIDFYNSTERSQLLDRYIDSMINGNGGISND